MNRKNKNELQECNDKINSKKKRKEKLHEITTLTKRHKNRYSHQRNYFKYTEQTMY